MLDAPALPPPTVVVPAPREVSFGLVAGTAPPGTERIVVHVGRFVVAESPLGGRSFSLNVPMSAGPTSVRVTAVDGRNRRSSSVVPFVLALPRNATPHERAGRLDRKLEDILTGLRRQHGGVHGIYVQDLRSGLGASWNAGARFPAASTLKLAIAVTALRRTDAKPGAGSRVSTLLARMLVESDNEAANELEAWIGGSILAGAHRVDETMRALGLRDSLMYGGYETPRRPAAATTRIPVRVETQPSFGPGKYTTAADLARLGRAVYLAAVGKGPLLRLGVSGSEARYLLWVLGQVTDRGKLDRFLSTETIVMHKAGWLPSVRHDNGVVAYYGGSFVAAVLTWRTASADELAGQVALFALNRFALG